MSKLFEARKNNIIKPLVGEEVGFVFENKHINQIIRDIKTDKYGAYLIGGVVGVGKSSLIDLATSFIDNKSFVIHVNFYSEEECIDKFPIILLEKIIETIKESDWIEYSKDLQEIVDSCENNLKNDILMQCKEEKSLDKMNSEEISYAADVHSRLGIGINYILTGEFEVNTQVDAKVADVLTNRKSCYETVTVTKKQRTWLEYIDRILTKMPCESIVLVYDELDKMNSDILEGLFRKYKALFVEKNIFHYFIVNDEIFSIYGKRDLLENPFYTYFRGMYYIPLLSFEETLRYCKMMFAENSYLNGLIMYYLSLGNYRLINKLYLNPENDSLDLCKAYILKVVYADLYKPYFDDRTKEIILRKIRNTIENILEQRCFEKNSFIEFIKRNKETFEMWPRYSDILDRVIEKIRELVPDAVENNHDLITIKGEELLVQNEIFRNNSLKERNEKVEEDKKEDIQLSDLYSWYQKDCFLKSNYISYLSKTIIPLKVADNLPEAYREALVNIIYVNLFVNSMQIIVLKRLRREDETFYKNDYVYSGIVVVDKKEFQVAYYIDQGSYSSDREDAIKLLVEEGEKLRINVKYIYLERYINLEEEIELLVNAYNNNENRIEN